MALMKVLHLPDPRLQVPAEPVEAFDAALRALAADMLETMYDEGGIGLAATQVGVHRRLAVVDVSEERGEVLYLANPEIMEREGEQEMREGCLSIPGVFDTVRRSRRIRFRARDLDGKVMEQECDGLLAICIQHEVDHLDGRLFIHRLSPFKQQRIRKRLEKRRRHAGSAGS